METLKRIAMTLLFLPILIIALNSQAYQSLLFTILVSCIGILGYFELNKLISKNGYIHTFFVPLSIIIIYASFYFKQYSYVGSIFIAVFIIETSYNLLSEGNFEKAVLNITFALFTVFYIGFMWGSSILLKNASTIDTNTFSTISVGVFHYAVLVTGTWMCDIGAYFIGRYFGKHKLNLPVSPNKSLEGFIGGVVISLLSLIIICYLLKIKFSIIMILIPIVTIIADLFESLIKRMVNEKDSGHTIPGHGGVLDVFDALIVTTPLYYFVIFPFIQ